MRHCTVSEIIYLTYFTVNCLVHNYFCRYVSPLLQLQINAIFKRNSRVCNALDSKIRFHFTVICVECNYLLSCKDLINSRRCRLGCKQLHCHYQRNVVIRFRKYPLVFSLLTFALNIPYTSCSVSVYKYKLYKYRIYVTQSI